MTYYPPNWRWSGSRDPFFYDTHGIACSLSDSYT